MKRLILFTLLLLSPLSYASDTASFRDELEAAIAKDTGFSDVTLILPPKLRNLESFELVEYKYAQTPRKVLITLKDSQGEIYPIIAKFDEAIMVPAPIADIAKGDRIAEAQLTLIKFPKSRETKHIINSKELLVGSAAKKNLPARRFISVHDITRPTLVSKGKGVKMVYAGNNISIETRGISLERGGINDYIKVRNIDSSKSIVAKILNEDTVLVGAR